MFRKTASDSEMLWAGRAVVLIIAIVALIIASNPNSGTIMGLVENAWGVFGAAFGPAILLSLFWRDLTFVGATTGIIVGAATDILWLMFMSSTGVYEIIPGFCIGLIATFAFSKLSGKPDRKVQALFDRAVNAQQ